MNKYPYIFEEFKKVAEKQFIKDYYNSNKDLCNKKLEDNDIQKAIIEGYNLNKFKHEQDIFVALSKLENEASRKVYCMAMLV